MTSGTATCTATVTWSADANYNGAQATQTTAAVKKAASVTPAPASKVYGSVDPALSGALSGFLVADGVTASYSRAAGETVGSYPIHTTPAPGGVVANYDITYNTASFDITKKAASVTPSAGQHKTYGDADPALSGSTSGFLAADGVTASYSRAAGETVAGGPYHITATLSPSGVLSTYSITNNGADFTIAKRAATWTTTANSKTYGDAEPSPLTTGSGSNFVAADGVTASYSRAAGETVAGGPYHITATLSPSGVLSNYSITNNGADFTIAKRAATWTTNANSKTYGDAEPAHPTTGGGSNCGAADG